MIASLASALVLAAAPAGGGMVRVDAGTVRPLFPPGPGETEVAVEAFELDRFPATNAEFLAFVKAQPRWRRDRLPRLFGDDAYLAQWKGPTELGAARPRQPVVNVSWFAAQAYCEWRGARLPTELEWELAAAAGQDGPDGASEPGYTDRILGFYARPAGEAPADVGGYRDFRGVHDMHGLVWEWVEDFGAVALSSDSRGDAKTGGSFCGGGAANAQNKVDYASFMRIAMRSSLEARFTLKSLGFRCARDVPEKEAVR